jgi:RNA polymerase sigma-70 factor (ECF subfamily)
MFFSWEGRREVAEPTLSELVVDARRGDRRAFAIVYDRFVGAVHAVVLARVRWGDAADVVQDVFLIAWERLPSVRDPAAFPGWLMMIARNRATDHLRRQRPTDEPVEVAVAPAPTAEAREALDAIRELPESYREILLMRLVEGMSGPEIAERTGLQPGSVRVNLHRGMKLLRERLGIAAVEVDLD